MKNRYYVILITILTVLSGLTGCSHKEQTSQTVSKVSVTPAPSKITPLSAYKSVLQDESPFFCVDSGKDLYISQINEAVSSDSSVQAKVSKFTVVDLENDNIPEVILQLTVNENEYFGFEVLSYKDGVVYGYTLWYRTFMDLKEDGTFSFSGGASDYGFGSITFTDKGYTIDKITYCEATYNSDNNLDISYFVNHKKATEEEFLSAIAEQNDKTHPTWNDFTTENISGLTL
ncbi:hypothetical protein DFR55_11226 [Herbinix hemicellulosilytica]|uniref:Putative secreted protein n=1 Tax=Herbinix hemicellulosilytica TaxID=1564487 RepID=A0A0H5SF33_HERHM|nr:hypothetical protein [Herbinix hemicellulosilytica]RBP58365.1 hypothetical protein DFR55_11226 [Herbinix hemicellulosilytica]CRZ34082.1 putative secreted protein [Herbinix hemicellulosilytica]